MTHSFSLNSSKHEELIDITAEVSAIVRNSEVAGGICHVYTPHTTAALTINENADVSVQKDILKGLASLRFENIGFSHAEGNSPAHIKSSLMGCSTYVFVEEGRLQLGTWQGIFFCEFDGPRTRTIKVKVLPEAS